MWIEPVVMQGRIVRLEPLSLSHAPGLLDAADPDLFRHTPQGPKEWSVAGFEENIREVLAIPDVVPFAVVSTGAGPDQGRVIGRTTYMDILPRHRGLEIGRTWIARRHQGTKVNPEMKFLMLRHAFERLAPPALRVQFRTGGDNLHSQRALAKLGAVREGVNRKDRILPGGRVRDSVTFSVIDDEWADLRRRLIERLGWEP